MSTPPTSSPPLPSTDTSPPPSSSSPPPQAPSNPSPPPASPPSNPPPAPVSPPTSPPASPPSNPPPAPVSPPTSPPESPPPASPPQTAPPPESPPPPATPPSPNSTPPPPPSPVPPPYNRSPPPSPHPPPPLLSPSPPDTTLSGGLIAGIAAGTVIVVALLIGFVFFLYNRRRTRRRDLYDPFYPSPSSADPYRPGQLQTSLIIPPPPSSPSLSTKSGRESVPKPPSPAPPLAIAGGSFKYEDLELATNGFAESNVLGQGGFGLVYLGTLSGKDVAIKKLKSGGGQGDKEFRAEVEIISRVHHRNLVSLVGYCVHEDQRLLVYEYVPNKTLDFHLHGSGRPTLDWPRRWKIALGSAKGLAYLHEDYPKIIHRDIKAANILLDYHFEPKVADFGLAKFVSTNMTHVSTRVMGTFGYLAPEYATSGKLTERSDVYSYGVMLLELITGRKPIMTSDPQMDQSLVNWARPLLLSRATNGDIHDELVDPWLEINYDQYDMTRLIHCAAAAVRKSGRKRPRMGQIERYLEGEISLEDLNAGMRPGDSNVKANSTEQEVLRKMAFDGILSEELAKSDQTSNYEMASITGANTKEMEQQRLNKMAHIRDPYRPGQLQTSLIIPPPPSSPSFSTKSRRESRPKPNVSPKPPSPAPSLAVAGGSFKYEDLELATNGFAESNVLGQGGFGLVYLGTLSGKEVAIKKLKSGGGQGDREFRAEVEIISRVHHRNLVSLVGYCVHEDQRLLVYEYVPNKTVDFHLHGSGRPTLDWPRRWKIALGSAKGLTYLHEDCDPNIIHRDIKAANILLDYHFEPKVADFGLAKFVSTNMTHVSTRVMGTFGYLAPEYATSGKLTERSDVYSYGVMLIELITGRKPIMTSDPQMDQSLVNWARPLLLSRATNGDIPDELVDPWLETNYDQYDMTRLIHCAAAAVRESGRKRPRMGQIERYLEGEISLEDLNAGMRPGDSNVKANSTEQEVLRKMAFDGILSEELAESDQTSDCEMASSTGANTEEMEEQRLNKMAQSSEV